MKISFLQLYLKIKTTLSTDIFNCKKSYKFRNFQKFSFWIGTFVKSFFLSSPNGG